MITKMNNKSKDFYSIMGKFFGSRIVQNETNDRIYDDNKKDWYIFFDNETPVAFVSIVSDVIKNVYSIKDDFLVELLKYVSQKINIKESVVTKAYINVYQSCGLVISGNNDYRNFVRVRSGLNG